VLLYSIDACQPEGKGSAQRQRCGITPGPTLLRITFAVPSSMLRSRIAVRTTLLRSTIAGDIKLASQMTPIELQNVLIAAMQQGMSFPWWAIVLAIAGSAAGGYFGSYLKKRGENHATRDDFADIREQLRITTRDTETIRQYLTSETWRSQQQWSARERFYSNLLTQLQNSLLALSELKDYYMEPGSEHTPDSQQGEYFPKLLTIAHESHREVQKLLGPAALYLSSSTVHALKDLSSKYWNVANFSSCTAEYADESHALVETAYGLVLAEAKKHLHLVGDANPSNRVAGGV
jgi:hypothetical protein